MFPEPLSPAINDTDLPLSLPDRVYATWLAARQKQGRSQDATPGTRCIELGTGYVHVLVNAKAIDERYGSFLKEHLRKIWLEILKHFSNGNLSVLSTDEDKAWPSLSDLGLERY